jgi:hypothetical protein
MREDNAATEIANSMSECMDACFLIASESPKEHRATILDGVSWFVEAAPLIESPDVQGPKDVIRRASEVAGRLQAAVTAWDGATDPPDSLTKLAREFLACI